MIAGSIVAMVTPMTATGAVDWSALDNLVEWHIAEGTHAIVAVGTTGESATLTVDEHCAVIERVVAQVRGRIPVIAGTGANCTREAIELTTAAKSVPTAANPRMLRPITIAKTNGAGVRSNPKNRIPTGVTTSATAIISTRLLSSLAR